MVFRLPALYAMIMVALLVVLTLVSWQRYGLAQDVLVQKKSLEKCRQMAQQILTARQAPEVAADTEQAQKELTGKIENWARQAGIATEQVVRIDPLAPRRIADSDYLWQGASLELTRLTLSQLASFAAAIEREDPRLGVSQLRLSAPRTAAASAASEEVWQAELALTYLLHSPKNTNRE